MIFLESGVEKKNKYIHIRSDAQLKEALADSARRHMRKETDEARYLLMKSLGLIAEEIMPYQTRGQPHQKKRGADQS